jgi:heat shock protein HslJ
MKKQSFLITLSALLTACISNAVAPSKANTLLQHHHWILAEINGYDYAKPKYGKHPSIEVDEKLRIKGFAGCNGYFGQGNWKENSFRVEKMGMSKMMCSDDMMRTEQVMSETLQEWNELTLDKDTLTLKNRKHRITFKRHN